MIAATSTRKPPRQVSAAGIATLKPLESPGGKPNLVAYQDDAGKWTIGFGHTGDDVYEGVTCTPEAAEQLLDQDLDKVEWAICKNVAHTQLSQNEFDALAMLLFNAGVGVLSQPHFKAAITPDTDGQINKAAVAAQFPKWIYITDPKTKKKVKSRGLINRRAAELSVWNADANAALPPVPVAEAPRPSLVLDDSMRVTGVHLQAPRAVTPRPIVPTPAVTSSATPEPPPSTVAQTPGGKSFLLTIGSVLVATGGELVNQIQALALQFQQIKASTDPFGKLGHAAAIALGVTVIGVAVFTYVQRKREIHHE